MQIVLILLWGAAAATKLAAALRMSRNGILARYPLVVVLLVVTAIRSLVLLHFFGKPEYQPIYSHTAALILFLEGLAAVAVFTVLVEHYPRFRTPGTIMLSSLGLAGALLSYLTRWVGVPRDWTGTWYYASLAERHVCTVLVVVLIGARLLLPRVSGIPIRQSAKRATSILTLQVGMWLANSAVTIALGKPTLFAYFAPLVSGFVTSLLWLLWMTPASDECEAPAPVTTSEQADLTASLNAVGSSAALRTYMRLRIVATRRAHAVASDGETHPTP